MGGGGLNVFCVDVEETGRVKNCLGKCGLKVTCPNGECSKIVVSNPALIMQLPQNVMAEKRTSPTPVLLYGEKKHSDWIPEWSIFCYTDCLDGPPMSSCSLISLCS